VLAGLECNFITYKEASDFGNVNGNNGTVETGSIGMLEQRPIGTDECISYAYTASGSYVATARTALVVGLAGAVAATALVLFEVLFIRVCCSRLLEGLAFNLAIVATGVVYAIFASPYCNAPFGCTWGTGTCGDQPRNTAMVYAEHSLRFSALSTFLNHEKPLLSLGRRNLQRGCRRVLPPGADAHVLHAQAQAAPSQDVLPWKGRRR
jgi:hypothetical protein